MSLMKVRPLALSMFKDVEKQHNQPDALGIAKRRRKAVCI